MKTAKYKYAGYWPRMWAYNVDLLILLVIYYFLTLLSIQDRLLYLICLISTAVYHAGFECSTWQATAGKKIMNLKVVDKDGNRIDFLRGLFRFFGKIVSLASFYIGFIMIGLDSKARGLHDRLAGTLVLNDGSATDSP